MPSKDENSQPDTGGRKKLNTPNKLSLSRILLTPFMALFMVPISRYYSTGGWNRFVAREGLIIALLIFIIGAVTDFFDGHLARKSGVVTNTGKLLDPIADKILILTAMAGFVQLGEIHTFIFMLVLLREFGVTFLRLVAVERGQVIAASKAGKWKTGLQIAMIIVLFLKLILRAYAAPALLVTIFAYAATILLILTVLVATVSGVEYFIRNRQVWED
ncbi:MAG: CDP-diacylglycerol--glycerol-3-phosphate 3-phosphatidyltransferase [Clostridiaceae bacterium]|nr:CDP-diacylglycerol--glycerol-3-phosphate 3-phosphatidyltransferase [Clostridiaceae bacterium]